VTTIQDMARISGHPLVVHRAEWRDMSVPERAREVWQAARLACERLGARQRRMNGTKYWTYDGPLSDIVHALFPTMPYDPEEGEGGRRGAKPVYDYLKANKNVVTSKVGSQYVQMIRDEYSEVTVTKKQTPVKSQDKPKGQRGGDEGEFPCDVPGCEDRPPYRFARYLGAHKSRAHGIPGTSDRATQRRERAKVAADSPAPQVLDLTQPEPVAPAAPGMADVDDALGLLRETIAETLTRGSSPSSMTPLERVERVYAAVEGLSAAEVIAAIRAQEEPVSHYLQHFVAVSHFATEVTQGLLLAQN
jgi:hypothetical protein